MAKRVTSEGANVEYKPSTVTDRVTAIGAEVEYKPSTVTMRTTAVGIMVEYIQLAAPPRKYGPAVQIMW